MKHVSIYLSPLAALLFLVGCQSNLYVAGFTGQPSMPMPDDAPVAVIGANRADPLQMRQFDQAIFDAKANQRMLGTSTIVTSAYLRDVEAAEAARQLGASLVLYNFVYLDSTVERSTQEFRRFSEDDNTYYDERRSFDTTRHWYEYRAYFFKPGGVVSTPQPLD